MSAFTKKEQQMILDMMIIMSRADGKVHTNEKLAIGAVCYELGIDVHGLNILPDEPLNFIEISSEIGVDARKTAMTVCHIIMECDGYIDKREASRYYDILTALGFKGHTKPKEGFPNLNSYAQVKSMLNDYISLINANPGSVKPI